MYLSINKLHTMKKFFLFSLIALSFISCRKETEDETEAPNANTFDNRIVGTWTLTGVDYDTELPSIIPGQPPTQLAGSATNVVGNFVIASNPNTISYDYTFDVAITGIGSIPISTQESGTWTLSSDETVIFLQLDNGETSQLKILEDTDSKQVYETTVVEQAPVVGDIDILTKITMTK